MDLIALYNTEILPKLNLELIYPTLNLNNKGRYYVADCPDCGKKQKAVVWKNTGLLICNRGGCGYNIQLLAYINGGSMPSGKRWLEIIKDLGSQVGITIPERAWSAEELSRFEAKERKQKLLSDFQRITVNALKSELGISARQYLEKRGFNEEKASQYDFGYYPSHDYIEKELQKCSHLISEIHESGIYRQDWNNRIIYPVKNLRHDIVNFWARDITGKADDHKKYLYMSKEKGGDLSVPFNLENAFDLDLISAEGPFDVLTLDAHGMKNVIGLGGSYLRTEQLEILHKEKIRSITLIPDNDKVKLDKPHEEPAGIKSARNNIINLANDDIEIYIVPPHNLSDAKDADEFVIKHGIDAFKNILAATKIHGFQYYAQDIAKRCNKSGSWSIEEQIKAFTEAQEFAQNITHIKRTIPLTAFWEELSKQTGVSQAEVNSYQQDAKEKKERKAIEQSIHKVNELNKQGNLEAAQQEILRMAEYINSSRSDNSQFAIKFLSELSQDFLLTEAPPMPSLITMHEQGRDVTFLPKGIVGSVVGAGGIGKTHWLTQLALSIILKVQFLGKFNVKKAGNVALILGENSYDDIHRLLRKTIKGMFGERLSPEDLTIINGSRDRFAPMSVTGMDASFVDRNGIRSPFYNQLLEDLIKKEPQGGWDLIVLDPASRFMGAEAEIDNAAATYFVSLLEHMIQQLKGKPTILIGHHINKTSIGKENTDASAARGVSGLTNGIRWQLNIDPIEGQRNKIRMNVTKTNHTGYPPAQILTKDDHGHLKVEIEESIAPALRDHTETKEDQPNYADAYKPIKSKTRSYEK